MPARCGHAETHPAHDEASRTMSASPAPLRAHLYVRRSNYPPLNPYITFGSALHLVNHYQPGGGSEFSATVRACANGWSEGRSTAGSGERMGRSNPLNAPSPAAFSPSGPATHRSTCARPVPRSPTGPPTASPPPTTWPTLSSPATRKPARSVLSPSRPSDRRRYDPKKLTVQSGAKRHRMRRGGRRLERS